MNAKVGIARVRKTIGSGNRFAGILAQAQCAEDARTCLVLRGRIVKRASFTEVVPIVQVCAMFTCCVRLIRQIAKARQRRTTGLETREGLGQVMLSEIVVARQMLTLSSVHDRPSL